MPSLVALSPALAEIVVALGYTEHLVARGEHCDFPSELAELPIYDPAQEVDFVLTDASAGVLPENSHTQVKTFAAEDMGDVWNHIRDIARLLGDEERGHHLVFKLQQRQATVAAGALDAPPGIICLDGISPLQAAGRWVPELIEMASGDNLMGLMGEASEVISMEQLVEAQPHILIVSPQGMDLSEIEKAMAPLTQLSDWEQLPAVKKKQVYLVDSHHYLGRPGPRLVEALEILGEIIHPEVFDFGHEGTGWTRFSA